MLGLLDIVVEGQFDTIQQLDDAIESLEDGLFDDRTQTRQLQHATPTGCVRNWSSCGGSCCRCVKWSMP